MYKYLSMLCFLALTISGSAGDICTKDATAEDNVYTIDISTSGVAISPSRLRFNSSPGSTKTANIKINNDTEEAKSFRIKFNDFNMNEHGKSQFVEPGNGKYGISNWVSVSPSFIEVAAGEKKEITVTLDVPDDEAGKKAAWGIMMIEEAAERKTLDYGAEKGESIAFGIVPTLAFGVFLYQNPPGVTDNSIEIMDFMISQREEKYFVNIEAENTGTGIAYCRAYVELTNLENGDQEKLLVKSFTIVPELTRVFSFELPEHLKSGKYSAVGVLDYGNEEEIEAAELDFEIK
ncbi:MAG: DUF916 domain-containing protein [Flavobacteriales bacterium]|nr:DUF916 domain-containing protein [Flavobacteriales bacterium]